jgi:hypothetical protein
MISVDRLHHARDEMIFLQLKYPLTTTLQRQPVLFGDEHRVRAALHSASERLLKIWL